jgi:hypothetical protein
VPRKSGIGKGTIEGDAVPVALGVGKGAIDVEDEGAQHDVQQTVIYL